VGPKHDELGVDIAPDDPAVRTELSRHLRASTFPAGREDLIFEACETDAPEVVFELLRRLPSQRAFATVHEVWAAAGGEVEHVRGRDEPR
jgi:hypothetical protein